MGANVTVLGAGGWGLALAIMAYKYGNEVTLWSIFPEEIEGIKRFGENKKLLPGVPIPTGIELSSDISCIKDSDLIIMAVPSGGIVSTAEAMKPYLKSGSIIVNAGKGLEKKSHRRFSEILSEILPDNKICVLSGPSHAEEVSRGVPTSIIAASENTDAAEKVQNILMNPRFRIYVNDDVIGVELGGALKNVIALASGICDGLEIGDNAKAALLTRGLAEIARLGVAIGARQETFFGLSGMGDLIVTAGSLHSRNKRAGMLIGEGHTPEEAVKIVGTVEGYHAAKAGYELSKMVNLEMPITETCYKICFEGLDPRKSIENLMTRPKKYETGEEV